LLIDRGTLTYSPARLQRKLISIGERLDGAGFWAAADGVMRSADKLNELARAIEQDLRRSR
jgi:hypothetical protein